MTPMDFIDPHRRKRNKLLLIIGYFLLAIAILLTTLILLYQANGYGFGKNGQVIQNGLVFVSSTPSPANIYLNGVQNASTTNVRLELPAAQYTLKLTRAGYRTWVRAIGVEGGSVEHFDYPFLFPTELTPTAVLRYDAQPSLVAQSPNRQWVLVAQPDNFGSFDEINLSNPKQLTSSITNLSIPDDLLTHASGGQSLQLVDWSSDNRHILLLHTYTGGSEYILLDRQTPDDSVNLTKTLNLNATDQVDFYNNKYDQYYLFDPSAATLSTISLSNTTPTLVLNHVLNYDAYGSNIILYATDQGATSGNVNIDLEQGGTNYVLRQLPISTQYLLDITQYSGNWFVALASSSDSKTYIYEDPVSILQNANPQPLVPAYILKISQPNYLSFSDNAQFITVESGSSIATYDAETGKGYSYQLKFNPLAGQHATWMDGDRLDLAINGSVVVFDYDGANQQVLQPAVDGTTPLFDPSYKWIYSIAPTSTLPTGTVSPNQVGNTTSSTQTGFAFTSTSLLAPADQ